MCTRHGGVPPPTGAGTAEVAFLNVEADVAYTGDASCASCHAEIAQTCAEHGPARSFERLTDSTSVENWSGGTVSDPKSGFQYTMRREGDAFVQEETRTDASGAVVHRLVREAAYVMGSGIAARTFIAEANGWLYELPVTWYTAGGENGGGHWAMSPGYEDANSVEGGLV